MTKANFKKKMELWGNDFYENTCPSLQAEIVRKIMNNKVLDDFQKISFLNQYIGNLVTNEAVVKNLQMVNAMF